ncbi:MAG: hypothetical protein CMG71_04900 [Candidatus Marinimicrobia bacterium]|nr:hypothetical protein [Candidatus Neomarinimicrobiota bacterium]|tara:strand:- start:8487 stop:9008 length:522 start_codon:yes stop_codon:yes gene_type:complete
MRDRELVKRFQNGDEEVFDELVKRHYTSTLGLLTRLSGNRMDGDDLCQEVFIRVYRGLKGYKFQSKFSTWLYRISINVANSHHRKEKVRKLFFTNHEPENLPEDEPPEPRELDPELWQAIQNLPQKQKTVLTLRIFQELRFKQIAAILDMTENSAKVNYHHSVKKLKETIGED